jgi:hypothetical protein
MASGDIHRDGSSGNQAGEIKGSPVSVRPHTFSLHALTAVRDSGSTLKLISWGVLSNGTIDRKKDSGGQAGTAADVSLARVFSTFDFYVTAVQDSSGNEKLISWRLQDDGTVGRADDSGNAGLDGINDISVVGRDDFNNVITGIWDANKKLKLESWRMNQNGQFDKRGDSANQAGEVQSAPELLTLSNGMVVSAVVTEESTLKLISWGVENDGEIKRLKDSGGQAGEVHGGPAAVLSSNGLIVTAVSDNNSKLKLIAWEVGNDGSIQRRGDSGSQAGKALGPTLSIARTTSMYVTATMDNDSKLKLISWSVSANGMTIDRKGGSGDQAGVITEGPAIHSSTHSNTGFMTAVKAKNGDLKMISWTVEPF